MAERTNISWCDSTWNCWIGCSKIGPGCDHCYAEVQDSRKRWGGKAHWGAGVPRYRTSAANWRKPLTWQRHAENGLLPDGKTPHGGRHPLVFCASLADVFDNEVPYEWRNDLWTLIEATPHLSWLLVTKRIGNVKQLAPKSWLSFGFPGHVRLLITVVNQEEADRDIPKLLAFPCKNGISYEPALGPVDWSPWLCDGIPSKEQIDGERGAHYLRHGAPRLDWVIVGGESAQAGHPARPMDEAWVRTARDQCQVAGTPFFYKQKLEGSRKIDLPVLDGRQWKEFPV